MPNPTTPPWEPGHHQPRVAAVMAILERVYEAMEDGVWLTPTDNYVPARKDWRTVEGRERLIGRIDAEFVTEFKDHPNYWEARGSTKHPEFYRLDDTGRRWLCEQLEDALKIPWNCSSPYCHQPGEPCPSCKVQLCSTHQHVFIGYQGTEGIRSCQMGGYHG